MKYTLIAILAVAPTVLHAQTLSFNPGLPNSLNSDIPVLVQQGQHKPVAQPSLSAYAGTYVGIVVYYNINTGIGDWEIVFESTGKIRLSDQFQRKYPTANVSGTFNRDGTFTYTNRQTNGLIWTTTGKIDRIRQKLSATFTSNNAGTGVISCSRLF